MSRRSRNARSALASKLLGPPIAIDDMLQWGDSKGPAYILDLTTGSRLPLTGDLGSATWLNDQILVAELFAQDDGQARLLILRADGTKEGEVLLPFTLNDEDEDFSPFADNLFAVPGDPESILYGRHAGDSTVLIYN